MKSLVEKLATVCNHSAPPQKTLARDWKPYLKAPKGSTVDEFLQAYLRECLFEKPLNLTFSLYSKSQLLTFIESDDLFPAALAENWFVIGDRDMTLICVHVLEGTVCLIPAWSVTEGLFTKEKRFKSLQTFLRGQLKNEKRAAQAAAKDDAEQAQKKDQLVAVGDVNAVDADGKTLLMLAASDGDEEAVRRLLESGADPNVPGKHSALFRAVQQRSSAVVALLVQHGADVNNGDPLTAAASRGELAIVQTLVEAGADLHGELPRTPLAMAVHGNSVPVVEYLIQAGVDVNVVLESPGSHGPQTVLSKARTPELKKLLLASGADPKVCPGILTGVIFDRDRDMVQCLLDAGAILDSEDLHRCRESEMLTLLLDARADSNVISYGRTPIIEFVRLAMGSPKKERPPYLCMIHDLLERGADVDVQDGRGDTALHAAIRDNYGDAVQAILEKQPDVTIKNNGGQIAADLLPSLRPKALRLQVEKQIQSLVNAEA